MPRVFFVLSLLAAGLLRAETTPEMDKRWHDTCLAGDTDQIDVQIGCYEARLVKNPKSDCGKLTK